MSPSASLPTTSAGNLMLEAGEQLHQAIKRGRSLCRPSWAVSGLRGSSPSPQVSSVWGHHHHQLTVIITLLSSRLKIKLPGVRVGDPGLETGEERHPAGSQSARVQPQHGHPSLSVLQDIFSGRDQYIWFPFLAGRTCCDSSRLLSQSLVSITSTHPHLQPLHHHHQARGCCRHQGPGDLQCRWVLGKVRRNKNQTNDSRHENGKIVYFERLLAQCFSKTILACCLIISVINKFTCEICGKQFLSKEVLKKHMQALHKGLRFSCDQCNFSSATLFALKMHIKTIHEKVKSFLCDQCDYKAASKNTLNKHIRTAHELIRYPCDQCE